MANYEDRRRGVSREDRIGDREAAEWRDRREEQVRTADMGQTPRNIAEYDDRVRSGYPRVSGDDRSGREMGRTDYAAGMRDDMRRYESGGSGSDFDRRPFEDRPFSDRAYGETTYTERPFSGGRQDTGRRPHEEDRFSDRGFGTRSFSGSLGGGMGQAYGYGQSTRGYRADDDHNNPRSYRSGRPRADEDRGFFSRAGDEIASWFGSDDAERRREHDARRGDDGAQHHVGRGPRNYKRSDNRIEEDINDRLTRDPHIDAGDIEVSVHDGEVTLSGMVDSRNDKRRAEDLADDVSGVRNVQNNLRIRGREGHGMQSGAHSTMAGSATGAGQTGTTGTGGTMGTSATGSTGASGTGLGSTIGTTGGTTGSSGLGKSRDT